jgi:hypothetical protein
MLKAGQVCPAFVLPKLKSLLDRFALHVAGLARTAPRRIGRAGQAPPLQSPEWHNEYGNARNGRERAEPKARMHTTGEGEQNECENMRSREGAKNRMRECAQPARVRTRLRRECARQTRGGQNKIERLCGKALVGGAAGGANEVQLCVLLRLVQGFGAGDGSRDGVGESDPEIGGQ